MEIFNCDQNSDEWFKARMGIPTSSRFKDVMARTPKGNAPGATQKKYMRELAGEIITGKPVESYSNADMERGHAMEDEARKFYALMKDATPELVGFIRNGNKGSSPDSLVGEDGMLEIKTAKPSVLIEWIEKDQFPTQHKAQVQGQLWVAERQWCDLIGYWPDMPPFIIRENRDDEYIAKIAEEVDRFNSELAAMVSRLKTYSHKDAA